MRSGATAYFLLPRDRITEGTTAVFSSTYNTIFQVDQGRCPRDITGAENLDKTRAIYP